jgi:hypothetical protein
MITYSIKGDKYVFCKDGVYFSLTLEQVSEMNMLFDEIYKNVNK